MGGRRLRWVFGLCRLRWRLVRRLGLRGAGRVLELEDANRGGGTALERKSRWDCERGLEGVVGFEDADSPGLEVLGWLGGWPFWGLDGLWRRGVVERRRIERLDRGSWSRLGARKS